MTKSTEDRAFTLGDFDLRRGDWCLIVVNGIRTWVELDVVRKSYNSCYMFCSAACGPRSKYGACFAAKRPSTVVRDVVAGMTGMNFVPTLYFTNILPQLEIIKAKPFYQALKNKAGCNDCGILNKGSLTKIVKELCGYHSELSDVVTNLQSKVRNLEYQLEISKRESKAAF